MTNGNIHVQHVLSAAETAKCAHAHPVWQLS